MFKNKTTVIKHNKFIYFYILCAFPNHNIPENNIPKTLHIFYNFFKRSQVNNSCIFFKQASKVPIRFAIYSKL